MAVVIAEEAVEFDGMACDGCGHAYHQLKECEVVIGAYDPLPKSGAVVKKYCWCPGDESQAREVWESQKADERWADRFERD